VVAKWKRKKGGVTGTEGFSIRFMGKGGATSPWWEKSSSGRPWGQERGGTACVTTDIRKEKGVRAVCRDLSGGKSGSAKRIAGGLLIRGVGKEDASRPDGARG